MLINRNSSLLSKSANKEDLVFKNKNDEGTLLLLEKSDDKLEILRTIGFNTHIDKVSKEAHVKNSKVQLGIKFDKPSYLGSDIKKLANDYDLTISRVANYKGAPFKDLPEIIQNFINEHTYETIVPAKTGYKDVAKRDQDQNYIKDEDGNMVFNKEPYELRPEETITKSHIKTGISNWFILAPREAFTGNKKNACCTLFYRDNDDSRGITEEDVFLEIHSWGSSYSDNRKCNHFLKYIDYKKEFNMRDYHYDDANVNNTFPSFYILTLLFLLSCGFYISYFIFPVVLNIIFALCIYNIVRKKSNSYLKLWKI